MRFLGEKKSCIIFNVAIPLNWKELAFITLIYILKLHVHAYLYKRNK